MKSLFFFIVLLAAQPSTAATLDPQAVERVANSSYWLRLLHFHGGKSDVDGKQFFLSPTGRKDAKAELLATIEAFEKGGLVGRDPQQLQHPQCAFPERRRFLREELKLELPKVDCPLYDAYRSRFRPEGTTLVFSAAYPYNPGSMFGHTFLRINSAQPDSDGKAQKKLDLLAHGLSYAASVTGGENSLLFIWNGLTGGFDGSFTVQSYYEKVNEYSNAESRDLWEYELDLNAEQTSRILDHVWELELNGTFDYFFFTDNCSYQILALLEIARPDWNLTQNWLHVIPSETLKRVLNVPGAVRAIKFRPSLYKKAVAKIKSLSPEQFNKYEAVIDGSNEAETDVSVLSAAISYFYYQKQKEHGYLPENEQSRFEKLLIQRSKVKEPEPAEPSVDETSRPDLGHYAYRLGTSGGLMKRGGTDSNYFQELQFRFAYHDLLNSDVGYTPFSEIIIGSATLRTVPKEKDLILEDFKLVSIVALSPWTKVEKPMSWKLLASYTSPKDLGCDFCKVVHIEGGAGLSAFLDEGAKSLSYILVKYQLEAGGGLPRKFRSNPGLEAGLLWNPTPPFKAELAAQLVTDIFSSTEEKFYSQYRFQLAQSFGKSIDLRAAFVQSLPHKNAALRHRESKLGINFYF